MWRRVTLAAVVAVALSGLWQAPLHAQEGKELFSSKRCVFCHKPDKKGTGPSLKEIAAAYSGKPEQLAKYLKGEAPPIVLPERAGAMQPYLDALSNSPEAQIKALADYILSGD